MKNPSAKLEGIKGVFLIPGWGRSPGGGHVNPFQYSYLDKYENNLEVTRHRTIFSLFYFKRSESSQSLRLRWALELLLADL